VNCCDHQEKRILCEPSTR